MATDDEHTALYSKLRASFLARHFAVGRYFRTNLFSQSCVLEGAPLVADILAQDPATQALTRWRRSRATDNPLMWGGQFLTCLAVEDYLGQPQAERILYSAIATLRSLYKFQGNHFDGYPIRWDPVTSDRWLSQAGTPQISDEFLIAQNGRYLFSNPATDPRHAPLRRRETLVELMGEAEADRYVLADGNKLGDWRWDYFDRYRRWELSMDELVGLMLGYFMISKLVSSPGIKMEVRRQVNNLGDYLAEHAYLLVRPSGGLNARGATGILPALEYPLVRAMLSITGNIYSSRSNFQGVMQKAGFWESLAGPLARWTLAGVAAMPLITPMLTGVISLVGLAPFVPEALAIGGIALPAAGIPAAISGVALTALSLPLARTFAIYEHRDCFDVSNDDQAQEVAVAFLLMENFPPQMRFQGWMFGTGFTGGKGGSYAAGFPPFLALTALDDTDSSVRNAYLGWLTERHLHPELEPVGNTRAEGCFASAIAVLLGAGASEEARLKALLDARYVEFVGDGVTPGNYGTDLPLVDIFDNSSPPVWVQSQEDMQPALDYMSGLALAWLHSKRRSDDGNPVTTAGFPDVPNNTAFWPEPTVPRVVVEAAEAGNLSLPLNAIQGTPVPRIDLAGAALFDTSNPPLKPAVPPPVLPARPTTLIHDKAIAVRPADGDVYTGIVLQNGDDYELEATGSIWPRLLSETGPNGWEDTIEWDARFPLHGSLDPVNAHPFCLLGRLGGYFFIGEGRSRERFFYHRPCPLWLRVNDVGSEVLDAFEVRVRVWGVPREQVPLRISCASKYQVPLGPNSRSYRDGAISHVGGIHPGGWNWKLSVSAAIAEIEAGGEFYVERPDGQRANVRVIDDRLRGKYLRTVSGGGELNNLRSLPPCT